MNCVACNQSLYQDVSGVQGSTTLPCNCTYHEACFLQHLATQSGQPNITCVCGNLMTDAPSPEIYLEMQYSHAQSPNYYHAHSEEEVTTVVTGILANNEAKNELKEIKKLSAAHRKSHIALNKHMRVRLAQFKDTMKPHIDAIKAAKKATLQELRQVAEYKQFLSNKRRADIRVRKFQKKYPACRHVMRRLIPAYLSWRYWQTPEGTMRRFLRYLF